MESMSEHPNAVFARRAYEAMATGDIPWMMEHTAEDVVFHQGGRFPSAGTYEGRDAMFGHHAEFMGMVDGAFRIDVHDVLATDDHAAGVVSVTIEKGGRSLTFGEVHLFRVRDGLLV